MAKITTSTQDVPQFIRTIFLQEMSTIINSEGAAYLKFLILIQGLEFLGACWDEDKFEKRGLSEKRFNAGMNLLGEKYSKFIHSNNPQNFYFHFRNPMIHQFKHDQSKITLATENSIWYKELHLTTNENGQLYVVLEPFYRDIKGAAERLIGDIQSGKLAVSKLRDPYLTLHTIKELKIQTT